MSYQNFYYVKIFFFFFFSSFYMIGSECAFSPEAHLHLITCQVLLVRVQSSVTECGRTSLSQPAELACRNSMTEEQASLPLVHPVWASHWFSLMSFLECLAENGRQLNKRI